MFKKNRKYKYEEIKEIFDSVKMDVITNPFGDLKKDADKELDAGARFTVMLSAMPILATLEKNYLERKKNNERIS